MALNKSSDARIQKKSIELSDFVRNRDLLAALDKVRKDKQLFRKARADPKGFLKGEGVLIPPGADVTISQITVSGGGSINFQLKVKIPCVKLFDDVEFCINGELHGGVSF